MFRILRWQRQLVLAFCGLCAVMAAVSWYVAFDSADRRIDAYVAEEVSQNERAASGISQSLAARLELLRGLPAVVASFSMVHRSVSEASSGQRDFSALNERLKRTAADLGADVVWILDESGACIAASNFDRPDSFVGIRYADRAYFEQAIRGQRGHQFAVGRQTGIPGLFYSAPIIASGRPVGAVVLKLDVQRLASLVAGTDAFITDRDGVIILASDPGLLMRALPGARVHGLPPASREAIYRRDRFDELPIKPAGKSGKRRMVLMGDSEAVHAMSSMPVPDSTLTVHAYSALDHIATIRADAERNFALMLFGAVMAAALVMLGMAELKRARQYQSDLRAANERLASEANTDVLTGCANRRRFLTQLEAEMSRARRHDRPLSVLMLDIDHFKVVNDTYGHACGDLAIKHLVEVTQNKLRRHDVVGRLGGEEFAVLLPETAAEGALVLAERIRSALQAQALVVGGATIAIRASIGTATFSQDVASAHDLLKRADDALYQAKRSGRNRVVQAGRPEVWQAA